MGPRLRLQFMLINLSRHEAEMYGFSAATVYLKFLMTWGYIFAEGSGNYRENLSDCYWFSNANFDFLLWQGHFARGKVVIQSPPPPNLEIMVYAPKRVSFGIKAFKAFSRILKNKALTIWSPSGYEVLEQSAPLSLLAWLLRVIIYHWCVPSCANVHYVTCHRVRN